MESHCGQINFAPKGWEIIAAAVQDFDQSAMHQALREFDLRRSIPY